MGSRSRTTSRAQWTFNALHRWTAVGMRWVPPAGEKVLFNEATNIWRPHAWLCNVHLGNGTVGLGFEQAYLTTQLPNEDTACKPIHETCVCRTVTFPTELIDHCFPSAPLARSATTFGAAVFAQAFLRMLSLTYCYSFCSNSRHCWITKNAFLHQKKKTIAFIRGCCAKQEDVTYICIFYFILWVNSSLQFYIRHAFVCASTSTLLKSKDIWDRKLLLNTLIAVLFSAISAVLFNFCTRFATNKCTIESEIIAKP